MKAIAKVKPMNEQVSMADIAKEIAAAVERELRELGSRVRVGYTVDLSLHIENAYYPVGESLLAKISICQEVLYDLLVLSRRSNDELIPISLVNKENRLNEYARTIAYHFHDRANCTMNPETEKRDTHIAWAKARAKAYLDLDRK